MVMKQNNKTPKRSLRTILMMWLLVFALVPLAFITGYSLVKYEQAIDQELSQRLTGNGREIQVIIQEFEKELSLRSQQHATDKSIIYDLSSNDISAARELGQKWMKGSFIHQLSIFNRESRLEVALYRDEAAGVSRKANVEGKDVYLSEKFISETRNKNFLSIVDFTNEGNLDLIMFSKILTPKGILVGYIEEILQIDKSFILGLKRRLNIEIAFSSKEGEKIVSSHDDLLHYRQNFFLDNYLKQKSNMFELNIRDVPFGVMVLPIEWGNESFFMIIGASKQATTDVLRNVNYAFFTVVGTIIFLLVFLSFIFSKIMLQPINSLVEQVQNVDFSTPPEEVKTSSENEIGILTKSFNVLVQRVYTSQKELKENIKKLEDANNLIREAQAKLVHTAKMASLGQLVAGVAHELNNPISFIYSNMTHLRDYSQRLVALIELASKENKSLESEKQKLEYDYVVKDLPKLIKSCEDGARRTRDIVVGLRNFSRLEEAKLKEVNIHEGIDSTLALLEGEFKSRIKIHKKYEASPKLMCYPNQLNQVFMNILSNAAQAIEEQGEIYISTKNKSNDHIEISIRDTGVGMEDSVIEKIFDPFYTTKEMNSGTGLGLSITYGIVKKHQGEISVKSGVGKGTEFIITLPVHFVE
jgi:two-component system NtrC family sensor kinase